MSTINEKLCEGEIELPTEQDLSQETDGQAFLQALDLHQTAAVVRHAF
jgi:hypothetical protein